jgi:DNA-directed RNA polymerase specialized sigma24 family protein
LARKYFLRWRKTYMNRDPERLPGWLATTARAPWRHSAPPPGRILDSEGGIGGRATKQGATRFCCCDNADAGDLLLTWSRQEALAQGMERLQSRCRQLLLLLFLDHTEPSYEEISEQLGLPKGSIGPTRNRCLQQLRTILEGIGVTTVS